MAALSYRLKLLRAVEHLRVLQSTVDRWAQEQPCVSVIQADVKTREHSWYVRVVQEPSDPVIPLLIGEAAHCLRQALDHLAYRLAAAIHGMDPPPNEESAGFPIYTGNSHQLDSTLQAKIAPKKSLPAGLYAILDGLQPYKGGDNEYLAALHLLDNTDKHRFLPLTAGVAEVTNFYIGSLSVSSLQGPRVGAVEDEAPVITWIPIPDTHTNMQFEFAPGIAFGKSSPVAPGQPVTVVFEGILRLVGRAIDECEPFIVGS